MESPLAILINDRTVPKACKHLRRQAFTIIVNTTTGVNVLPLSCGRGSERLRYNAGKCRDGKGFGDYTVEILETKS